MNHYRRINAFSQSQDKASCDLGCDYSDRPVGLRHDVPGKLLSQYHTRADADLDPSSDCQQLGLRLYVCTCAARWFYQDGQKKHQRPRR